MTDRPPAAVHELDRRSSDGIDVALAWNESSGRVTVAVSDSKTGTGFVIDVREDEAPLDVFRHPFAYAAWHRVPTENIAPSLQQTAGAAPSAVGGVFSADPPASHRSW